MAIGLLALLDDISIFARAAAASLDDVAAAAGKATAKAAGVVIDDAAVTPRYALGVSPARELPMIWRIAKGSLKNKLLILLPAALLLSWIAPWAITPILMIGGLYLAYESAEKVWEALLSAGGGDAHADAGPDVTADPAAFEESRVSGAITTDFILSTEIMSIALASVSHFDFWTKAAILGVVGLLLTALVYGAVAILVKIDDIGCALARPGRSAFSRTLGKGLVNAMPKILDAISVVGTAAMAWVGGGIILHGLETFGWSAPAHFVSGLASAAGGAVPWVGAIVAWLVEAAISGIVGLALGSVVLAIVTPFRSAAKKAPSAAS